MMNQHQYKQVLQRHLILQLRVWFPNNKSITFMHDYATCHKANKVPNYLEKNEINVLPWPGNSPDPNPIENLWENDKQKIAQEVVTDVDTSITRLKKVRSSPEISAKTCIESKPRRVNAVWKAKGKVSKY